MRISPLRQRMIDDMTARHFSEKAQKDYIRCVKNLAAFIGRPPEAATAEDLRLYRLHLVQSPLGASSATPWAVPPATTRSHPARSRLPR